ncbi:MAG: class I adenylate-forming enzyme family protein [Pseudomonadota bacterium]
MSERFPNRNLGDIVAKHAQTSSAYVDTAIPEAFAHSTIDDLAARLSTAFSQRFARGDRVALIARNGIDFTLSYLGLMRAGLVPVPINYRQPKETVEFILGDAAVRGILFEDDFADLVPKDLVAIAFGSTEFENLKTSPPMNAVETLPGELCEILYTSGSTGKPKGVPLDHHGQIWALDLFLDTMGDADERTAVVAPTYHMNGLFFTTVALALGWQTYSMPAFDARAFLKLIAREKITLLSGIPTMFAMMARETDLLESLDFSSVTGVIIGSAPLTNALIDRVKGIFPKADIRNSYGTTESGPAMFGPHPEGLERPPLAIGYPYPGVQWKLVGGDDCQGRLLTKTPAVLDHYLNLPDVTDSKLTDGWYDTGDIVRRDEDGWFYYVSRADDMFVCGGENIYPGEVEKLLERHPAVLQAAVLPVEDTIKGAIPIGFVTLTSGASATVDELKQFTLENGPAYAHPRTIIIRDSLPIGGTHKVDRKALEHDAQEAGKALLRG